MNGQANMKLAHTRSLAKVTSVVEIQTRRDLARHLQVQMAASRRNWFASSDSEEETPGRTMLKTYLLEAHHSADGDLLGPLESASEGADLRVKPIGEEGIFHLEHSAGDFWLDTSMDRYWRMHTTVPVAVADAVRDAMVTATKWLDNVWLPPDYLEHFAGPAGARLLTFSLNHDRRRLNPPGKLVSDSDFVSLRLWSSDATQPLRRLREAEVFPHGVSIRSVRVRSGSDEDDGDFCVAEYFHHGKITANGTSFDEHNRLSIQALRDYRTLVENIERKYGLAAETDAHGHPILSGDPLVIDIDWAVADLEYAVHRIFSSAEPFRLWGLPERVNAGHYRARAVDLHFGGVLSFDITPQNVVIQLPRRVCGNTVVRFMNNLRFHVNSDAIVPS